MTRPRPVLVIGWMPVSQRSTTLARRLGADVLLLGRAGFRRPWTAPFAYPGLAVRSIAALMKRRPAAVIVVAPPFVAPLIIVPVARILGSRVAVDIHSGALLDRRWRWATRLLAFACRGATATIVTLESLASRLRRHGVERTVVLPDPIPNLAAAGLTSSATGPPTVVAVLGWSPDEPILELIESARGAAWDLVLTGRPGWPLSLPPNVCSSGFLADQAYVDRLASANLVIVLTTRDETLLSGAWEALALGRPLLVSATPSLIGAFGPAIAAAGATAADIRAAVDAVLMDTPAAEARSRAVGAKFRAQNDAALDHLAHRLGLSASKPDVET